MKLQEKNKLLLAVCVTDPAQLCDRNILKCFVEIFGRIECLAFGAKLLPSTRRREKDSHDELGGHAYAARSVHLFDRNRRRKPGADDQNLVPDGRHFRSLRALGDRPTAAPKS
jgi:hypothetical protein